MKQEYITEITDHQEKMLAVIHTACAENLEECGYIVEGLEDKIITGMRWSLVLRKKDDDAQDKIQTRTTWDKQRPYSDKQDLLQVSCAEIFQLQDVLKTQSEIFVLPIFSPLIEKYLKDKTISVTFEYEDLETDIHVKIEEPQSSVDDLLAVYSLQLTLPEYDTVFPDCGDLMKIPQWILKQVDIYEQFTWDVRELFQKRDPYVQIGGYGRWIQGAYPDSYIAQVNNDVGDAGSVFLCCSEEGKIDAWVDMH